MSMQVHPPETTSPTGNAAHSFGSPGARRALGGFFISGVLLSFLGAILPAWGHHLSSDYAVIGWYFVGLIAGLVGSVWISPALMERKGTGWTLALACGLAGSAFLFLAFVSPPASAWWRVGGMAVIGCAAGLLHRGIFHAISPIYRHDPVATVNMAGILFVLGCLTVALLISGTFYIYTAPAIQVWIAVIPALFGWSCLKAQFTSHPAPPQPSPRAILSELRSPAAVLLSLLLFFQLGNEWAIAGWLPLFLSQRLGISPAAALHMLALYWVALLIGRVAAQWFLPRVSHGRLLTASVLASTVGCLILLATDNQFGAMIGVLLVGASYAPIYPLVVEKIGRRFPYYHPGYYNGIFSFALAGGLLAPCTLGYFTSLWGIEVAMGLPLAGSLIVFALLMILWLEARFSSHVTTQVGAAQP
jgi:FHS family glucose/mannose:H+ symporter-like MFS transporter